MRIQGCFLAGLAGIALTVVTATAHAQDPRSSLEPGLTDAGVAAKGMELLSTHPRPEGFFSPVPTTHAMADLPWANSDMAFKGNTLFLGSFRGFQIFDISDPKNPKLRTAYLCPGGQGDMSIHGKLLFMSVEMPNGRIDCKEGEFSMRPDTQRFMGVRIFDVSDIMKPKQVAAVQTCRGSHTHTLVTDRKDPAHVYIYVSGTNPARSPQEVAGCSGQSPEKDPNTAYFRIEVIKVPVAAPQNATIVNSPRIFADTAGNIAGLWPGGAHGADTQTTSRTDQCHDITAFPEIGLAAGACSGNGILLDISDPANPKRIAEVVDPNFAYWHSATFNNDGTKVLFTDEWGGGMAPRCQATDRKEWGADALFDIVDRKLKFAAYYKLPAAQGPMENCVAHNGSLIPVPGRDIMAQAWYQGGISLVDFTDTKSPFEIAYFDRGAYDDSVLHLGGFWSSYWYNGHVYGSEIGRGLDILTLTPSEHLTQNEIDAAKLARLSVFNPQNQTRYTWPASFVVARAYLDQLRRAGSVPADRLASLATELDQAEKTSAAAAKRSALTRLAATAKRLATSADQTAARRLQLLAENLAALAK